MLEIRGIKGDLPTNGVRSLAKNLTGWRTKNSFLVYFWKTINSWKNTSVFHGAWAEDAFSSLDLAKLNSSCAAMCRSWILSAYLIHLSVRKWHIHIFLVHIHTLVISYLSFLRSLKAKLSYKKRLHGLTSKFHGFPSAKSLALIPTVGCLPHIYCGIKSQVRMCPALYASCCIIAGSTEGPC